jgi:hypothetical protein
MRRKPIYEVQEVLVGLKSRTDVVAARAAPASAIHVRAQNFEEHAMSKARVEGYCPMALIHSMNEPEG